VRDDPSQRGPATNPESHPIVLYDGVCGLCNRLVQFILRRDPEGDFRFAPLQSALAGRILARHGANPGDLDTAYVVVDYELPEERLLGRSDVVIFVLTHLTAGADLRSAGLPLRLSSGQAREAGPTRGTPGFGLLRVAGFLLRLVPRPVRNWGYGIVVRSRYRLFGRYDACPLPTAETRSRFLDF
jgi:predicted DCC family thiol-disulfide oxidoreductase YuxK